MLYISTINKYLKTRSSKLRYKDYNISFSNIEINWSLQYEEVIATIKTFKYLEEYKLIIYREYGYTLYNLDRYLVEYYVYLQSIYKTISRLFDSIEFIFPEDTPLLKAYGPPIEGIALLYIGFLYNEKGYRFTSIS